SPLHALTSSSSYFFRSLLRTRLLTFLLFFFFNATATTAIYTLSLHDALPISLAGCTPVTSQSGKHRSVQFRWACNKRFRIAMTTFADNSRHASPWAAKIYSDARASGKDHPHAVRILASAWTRAIWPCWLEGIPYDPARHGAAAALARQTAQPTPAR